MSILRPSFSMFYGLGSQERCRSQLSYCHFGWFNARTASKLVRGKGALLLSGLQVMQLSCHGSGWMFTDYTNAQLAAGGVDLSSATCHRERLASADCWAEMPKYLRSDHDHIKPWQVRSRTCRFDRFFMVFLNALRKTLQPTGGVRCKGRLQSEDDIWLVIFLAIRSQVFDQPRYHHIPN